MEPAGTKTGTKIGAPPLLCLYAGSARPRLANPSDGPSSTLFIAPERMKQRYRLIRRGERGAKFYCVDAAAGRRTSLRTSSLDEARQLVLARKQALRQPTLDLHIAKAYLAGSDSGVATRTWQQAMEQVVASKQGANQARWQAAIRDHAFDSIRAKVLIETRPEQLLEVLRAGRVSTNVFLRKLHNFCLDMTWLPWPVVPKRQWPPVKYKPKRAITLEEHQAIVARETNPETRAFYQLAWFLGGSQSDLACLCAEDIDWAQQTIGYWRRKTGSRALLHFGPEAAALLRSRPASGPLFPRLAPMREKHRAKEFRRRCLGLGIHGVTLHSYRYAWAERALRVGMSERFAQEALGHNSKAVHRAYAKRAPVKVPSLEDYERRPADGKIVPFQLVQLVAATEPSTAVVQLQRPEGACSTSTPA